MIKTEDRVRTYYCDYCKKRIELDNLATVSIWSLASKEGVTTSNESKVPTQKTVPRHKHEVHKECALEFTKGYMDMDNDITVISLRYVKNFNKVRVSGS